MEKSIEIMAKVCKFQILLLIKKIIPTIRMKNDISTDVSAN